MVALRLRSENEAVLNGPYEIFGNTSNDESPFGSNLEKCALSRHSCSCHVHIRPSIEYGVVDIIVACVCCPGSRSLSVTVITDWAYSESAHEAGVPVTCSCVPVLETLENIK